MVFVTDISDDDNDWQSSIFYTRETATTSEQIQTEKECSLYLTLLDSSGNSQHNISPVKKNQYSNYFAEKGLIIARNGERSGDGSSQDHRDGDISRNDTISDAAHAPLEQQFQVGLVRDAHAQYLLTVFHEHQRLRPSFTSLDSSHTWMIYWCLHGLDLLGKWPAPPDQQPRLTERIVSTIQSCWTKCNVSLPKDVVESDPILSFYAKESGEFLDATVQNGDSVQFVNAGGFGGGPDQLPHAATTYAAIMSLCIIASSSSSSTNNDKENAALQYLLSIRGPVYIWFCSLNSPSNGSFRMHMDGEMDVRATYCVLAVIHILQMIPPMHQGIPSSFFTQHRIADYLFSCQSMWEGGYGGEPGAEAHGGYTYCAVASLQLLHVTSSLPSIEFCASWLAQRQMSYEGGFSGRINKLVDGCYSFWQGAATIIVQEQLEEKWSQTKSMDTNVNHLVVDPGCTEIPSASDRSLSLPKHLDCLFDADMLERYVLLCSQDENGGLRDKPSKGRDFYHSCYCLSGLSIAQHFGHSKTILSTHQNEIFRNEHTIVHRTHPCYNIRVEHVEFCKSYFRNQPLVSSCPSGGTAKQQKS